MILQSSNGPENLQQLREMIEASERIVFFTGAGISTESGIADFRSPGGIWSQMKPIQYADFLDDEETRLEDWRRRFHFQAEFDAAPVNDGHRGVASVLAGQKGRGLITQNIDGLHQRSGVDEAQIVEIHGNGTRAACLDCKSPMPLASAKRHIETKGTAPRCGRCNGLVKAAVISFGQPMPQEKVAEAEALSLSCDLFVVLGSSLAVQPAATMPVIAKHNGAKLVIINQAETPLDRLSDVSIHASIGDTLKKVLENTGVK